MAEHVFYILPEVTIWLDKAKQQTGNERTSEKAFAAKPERHDFGGGKGGFPLWESQVCVL